MTTDQSKVLAAPLAAVEKAVLAGWPSKPSYAWGRCATHGIIAVPDRSGAIQAKACIECPNPICSAVVAPIADPKAY